jgi:3-dehydroquinate dehydratase / shikimate dehydrogenase
MICISIAQESRRFALADMVNASKQCDLIEVRLDRFAKAPDVGELVANKPKPVIFSCRRRQDGGEFEGSEEERLALLRQCIISKADFVEIELDVADQIRKFPPAKRVISYTNFQETPADIADIYAEMQTKNPDVIKLETLARTPEEAWPLVQILAKPAVPTVVVGLGKPGVMLTVLGRKIGAPFTYAALERGMESYPGQPTVADLEKVYHYNAIGKSTRLIGVTGFGEQEVATVAVLNGALAHLGLPARCLPMQIGSMRVFRKVIEAVKLAAVVVDAEHHGSILEIATEQQPEAAAAQAADLILHQKEKWHGYSSLGQAAAGALEEAARGDTSNPRPLADRPVMIVGSNPAARALAFALKERGAVIIIASRDRDTSHDLAKAVEGRHIQFEALYSTMHDILVVCNEEKLPVSSKARIEKSSIHAAELRHGMIVMDLTSMPKKSSLLREAEARACRVVSPRRVLLELLGRQFRLLSGKDVPQDRLSEIMSDAMGEDD